MIKTHIYLFNFVKKHEVLKISDYIRDLLLFHEKVVLSGFGAFELIRKPAIFKDHTASPPNLIIIFNSEETLDDNLLTSKIAEAEEINFDEANQKILEFIDEIKFAVNKGEKFSMPGFGELFLDENNNFTFIKDADFRIEFENLGFETFELNPLDDLSIQESNEEIKAGFEEDSVEINEGPAKGTMQPIPEVVDTGDFIDESKSNRYFLWILGGSVVVIMVAFLILALSTDLFENLNTGIFKTEEREASDRPQIIFGAEEEGAEEEIEKEFDKAIDSLNKLENALSIPAEEVEEEPAVVSAYSEFHLIAGSFSVYKNAEDLQKELNLQGFPSLILSRGDGYFRVSAISYNDKEKALKELETFKNTTQYKSAWVLGIK